MIRRSSTVLVLSWALAGCSDGTLSVTTDYDDLLVDDFEAEGQNVSIYPMGGRQGGWFWFNDKVDQQPAPATRECEPGDPVQCMEVVSTVRDGRSTKALHTAGGPNYGTWGAGAGASLAVDFYDVTRFRGLRFWARAPDDVRQQVRVNLPDRQTSERGGICDRSEVAPDDQKCNDHFGQLVTLSAEWQRYEVEFAEMKQKGLFKAFDEFDATAVSDVSFLFESEGTLITFDLWIDNLEFVVE